MISLLEKLHRVHGAEGQRWRGASLRAGQEHLPPCPPAFPRFSLLFSRPFTFLSRDLWPFVSGFDGKLSESELASVSKMVR